MHSILNRSNVIRQFAGNLVPLVIFVVGARADIYQWEYINPADPSQGKRQSTALCPGGAGVDAVPRADLSARDLTMAYLIGADLSTGSFLGANLAGTNLSLADLTNAKLIGAALTDAGFAGAEIRGANFAKILIDISPFNSAFGSGITPQQLYSTASYQAHDLSSVDFAYNNLAGGNFAGQNLANTNFDKATLTDADFTGANVRGASFAANSYPYLYGGLALSQLYSTVSYQAHDLSGIGISLSNLIGANFVGQNLTNADFSSAFLWGADFTDADVRGTIFDFETTLGFGRGITLAQLYSTASYKAHDLSGISLRWHELAGGNFQGLNLTNSTFLYAALTGADFTAADARGGFVPASNAITTNLIWHDGHIDGLELDAGQLLVVRDYDGNPTYARPPVAVTVDKQLTMSTAGTLRMVFEADAWDSTISFAPGIPVALGGTLELAFAADVNLASQIGRTFHIFDWTGVAMAGALAVSSPYRWDLSQLYTTGKVTLTAIPEPTALILLFVGFVLLYAPRRGRFVLSVVLISACAPSTFAELPMTGTYIPELQAVDMLLQNFMVGKPIPGGTIAITHDDKVIYERGIGYSNETRTVPMQETAMMRLASVSKPITASAIQQLAKDGQISLDDKVFNIDGNGGILNITPYNGTLGDSRLRDITLQHLLEHKGGWNSGIAGDMAFQDLYIATTIGVPSPPGIANSARYILSRPLQFTPGSAEYYSNIGYMFLGMVVEAASGQAYESYVENHVLAPAGIPAWEVDAGRTFAENQNPREPVYSSPDIVQNVYNPGGPLVSGPYGGWDHEKALAYGGLIASSKAIALLAQSRIASGPDVGKLRSEFTTNPQNIGGQLGALPGTLTLMVQESSKDWTYSILFDQLPAGWSSDSISLFDSLNQILDGLTTWPEALVYAGDFTNDQWLTLDDVMLFKQALALGSQTAFTTAYPLARYGAGDFDGDGQVNASDAVGLVSALQHAGVPAEFTALVPELPGDYNRDGGVDAADYVVWRDNVGATVNLPNEVFSLGVVDESDYEVWRSNFGNSLGAGSGASPSAKVPEPSALFLVAVSLVGIGCCYPLRRRPNSALQFLPAIFPFVAFAATARADIYQWEYINPAHPSQGTQQSTTLAPDGAGVDAVPHAFLSYRNLTQAYLIGADLTYAFASLTNLTHADLSHANLANADLSSATLVGANLPEANLANVRLGSADLTAANFRKANLAGAAFAGNSCADVCYPLPAPSPATLIDADFTSANMRGADLSYTGITLAQLYSTANYQAKDLSEIRLKANNLAGGNFVGQNLTNTSFYNAALTDADFTSAEVRGADFSNATGFGITAAQLYSTASYQARDSTGIALAYNDFSGGNFVGQNLTRATFDGATLIDADFTGAELNNVSFYGATLTNADFTGADVRGASFSKRELCSFSCIPRLLIGTGIAPAQLYTTASYHTHNLSGIDLNYNELAGANFAGQILTDASFLGTTLAAADFTGADTRSAQDLFIPANAITTNLIRPNGHINALELGTSELLVVHDYDRFFGYLESPIPITVDQRLAMDPSGTLRMVFDADSWNSTISFAPDIPITLGGTLELTFAADVIPASQVGRTFAIFDWTDVDPVGAFAISSPYFWDVSNLYSTGEVKLMGIPEPSALLLLPFGVGVLFPMRHAVPNRRRRVLQIAASLLPLVSFVTSARADIFQWEYINPADSSQGKRQSTTLSPDGAGVDAVPGANLFSRNLTMAYLIGADLTGARGEYAIMTNADFTGAEVQKAKFNAGSCYSGLGCFTFGAGITTAQLYSTASYQAHQLSGIGLFLNDLTRANFVGQDLRNAEFDAATLTGADFRGANLTNAGFYTSVCADLCFVANHATLTNANFTAADARGANLIVPDSAITTNLIPRDGRIDGLDLNAGGGLVVRDYDGNPLHTESTPIPITILQHLSIGPGGTLRMLFEADAWNSTISFASGIPVMLGGTLALTFANDVNLDSQISRTFHVFDWTGVTPTGTFAVASPYAWDLSNLYTTGEVTLTAIPEPATMVLLLIAVLTMNSHHRAGVPKTH